MAVMKMSPDVPNAIACSGNHVFPGLTSRCAFDRFWTTQCHHCQKFGHTKDRCPAKNTSHACSFCAGPHTSLDCPEKSVLKCVNCSSLGNPVKKCQHFSFSLDWPVMICERNRVMENMDFGSSKNAYPSLEDLLYVDSSNIRPIRNKLCFVVESLAERNLDLLCITETWSLTSDDTVISATLPSYSFHLVPRSMSTRGGCVGLICSRALSNVRVVPNQMDISYFEF